MKYRIAVLWLSLLICLSACGGQNSSAPADTKAEMPVGTEEAVTEKPDDPPSPEEQAVPESEDSTETEAVSPENGAEIPQEQVEEDVENTEDTSASQPVAMEDPLGEETSQAPEASEEEELPEGAPVYDYITEDEYDNFKETVPGIQPKGFRDFSETMNASLTGTWFDPTYGESFRINEDGAFVYIPYLNLYGEGPYRWSLADRSERGKCPELRIFCFGEDGPALVYYIAGNTGEYFWCVSQGQVFYKQSEN